MDMVIRKFDYYKVHAHMARSLKEYPLSSGDIRIAVYVDDYFEQYLDVPACIPDDQINMDGVS